MGRRAKLGRILLGFLFASGVSHAEQGAASFDAFLKTYSETWNRHDGQALSALFAADADLIMGNLPRVAGQDAIAKWWNTYFSRLDDRRRGAFEVLTRREVTRDVQLVNVESRTFGTNAEGNELPVRLARGTWVVVKTSRTWRIAAMRGLPAEGEQRLVPGTDR